MNADDSSLPDVSARQAVVDGTELQNEILASFRGNVEPVRIPPTYRFGILLVAVTMIILPLLYLAIIALVGYGVYYHAVNHQAILEMGRGRGRLVAVLVYFAPMVVGSILVLFMFKPLLSRPAKRPQRDPLERDEEPLLFAFVERVCAAVRAPRPKRIEVDCEVNASASFRRGLSSLFGNDLVLTIGMPLVAGLNLRELAGVLAHEFGHFSQGAGMRLTYIIRMISHWFTRVVYERDEWDERLVAWAEGTDLRIGWILHLARLFVWITRKILWGLMIIGHTVSGFMLRQMEFDADKSEVRLAGSDAFESTMRKILSLSIAARGANSDLEDFYREGRLADDLPRLILHNVDQFTPDVHGKLDEMVVESTTGFLDTHPSHNDRIASARREDAEGIFHLELPASHLFTDCDKLCQRVTLEHYRDIFGKSLRSKIHPLDELLDRQQQEAAAFHALHRYLQGTFRGDRPLRLPTWQSDQPAEPEDGAPTGQRVARYDPAGCHRLQAVLRTVSTGRGR